MVHTFNAIITATLALSAAALTLAAPVQPRIDSGFSTVDNRALVPPGPVQPPVTEPEIYFAARADGDSDAPAGPGDSAASAAALTAAPALSKVTKSIIFGLSKGTSQGNTNHILANTGV